MDKHDYDLYHYVCIINLDKAKEQYTNQFNSILKGAWKFSEDIILLEREDDILILRLMYGEDYIRHGCLDDPDGAI